MEGVKLQKYQLKLQECQHNFKMLNERLKSASNKQSKEELILNQIFDADNINSNS